MDIKVCLVFIFNHRYDDNIPKLRKIYGKRFRNIRYLVPFYVGTDEEVIPVYESSYQFQGYLIQAYTKLMEVDADFYFFIADDLILNPLYNENNIMEKMNTNGMKAVTSDFHLLNDVGNFSWSHARFSSRPFFSAASQWKGSLPSYSDALKKFAFFWGRNYPEKYKDSFFAPLVNESYTHYENAKEQFKHYNNGTLEIPYPLAWGYSDIFGLHRDIMHDVAHTCGVFSAMNLFVEIAIPTSIVLNVNREWVSVIGENDEQKPKTMWDVSEVEQFAQKFNYSYHELVEKWDEHCIYVHPVKLSKWKV